MAPFFKIHAGFEKALEKIMIEGHEGDGLCVYTERRRRRGRDDKRGRRKRTREERGGIKKRKS